MHKGDAQNRYISQSNKPAASHNNMYTGHQSHIGSNNTFPVENGKASHLLAIKRAIDNGDSMGNNNNSNCYNKKLRGDSYFSRSKIADPNQKEAVHNLLRLSRLRHIQTNQGSVVTDSAKSDSSSDFEVEEDIRSLEVNCPSCKGIYSNSASLVDHLKSGICKGLGPTNKCPRCKKQLDNLSSLIDHLQLKSCHLSGIVEVSSDDNEDNRCPSCSRTYASKNGLISHIKSKACEGIGSTNSCLQCKRVFGDLKALKKHMNMQICHNSESSDNKSIKCPKCHRKFSTKEGLAYHYKKNVCEGIGDSNRCPKCTREFGDLKALKKHMNLQTCQEVNKSGDERNICPSCSRTYTTKASLLCHIKNKVCDGIGSSNTCPYCKRTFGDLKALRKHINLRSCNQKC
jgi:hypothetical protein